MQRKYTILQSQPARLLHALGISPTREAYWYMLDIIDVLQDNPQLLAATRKLLYPEVAKRHNVAASAVESAVRRAMAAAKKSQALPDLDERATAADFLAAVMQELARRSVTTG